jgi:hypothetical protein
MALHRDEVAKAIALLKEINNGSSAWEDVSETSRRNNIVPGKMVFQDEKSDGGWEAIDLDIENITPEQMSVHLSKSILAMLPELDFFNSIN